MKLLHVLLVVLYCLFLFWLSSGPVSAPKPLRFDGFDKVAHTCAFGLLAAIIFHGLRQSGRPWTSGGMFLIPVLFVALYGASDEYHQYFVPSRSCDILDWLADVTGALVAVTALSVYFNFFGSPVQEPAASPGE